ncbi:hypothetical protein B0J13DRAFT_310895 [Dactylonectria estremocensis]|uniref:Uncharacterized protein n=1 Tax=Dactylonectria estremocensis TaxID=1079267 RepID=A0A9P9F220_9HYPO|nr:hypothetical protein B0J13DRAFT_310895 [Dactylonectria estremocensis]
MNRTEFGNHSNEWQNTRMDSSFFPIFSFCLFSFVRLRIIIPQFLDGLVCALAWASHIDEDFAPTDFAPRGARICEHGAGFHLIQPARCRRLFQAIFALSPLGSDDGYVHFEAQLTGLLVSDRFWDLIRQVSDGSKVSHQKWSHERQEGKCREPIQENPS